MYTGREYDRGLKLYYNRARYYNPSLGRFISRDPIDIADDVNLYAYVENNGVMFVDRMGLSKALIFVSTDKEFFGQPGGAVLNGARLQYRLYLALGYKEENIVDVYGDDIYDFINAVEGEAYKDIALIGHSNSNEIDLDGTTESDIDAINSSTLNKLPTLSDESIILTLIACNAGNGNNSIAEKIAKQMQVTVRASSTLLSTGDGHFIDAGDSIYDIIEGPFNVAIGKKAKFITFKP